MLAAQPGPDLAVALPGERRVGQHLADQPHQLLVADRGHRPGSAWRPPARGGRRSWSGARRAPGTPPPRAGGAPWLSGPLRRRDLQPPFSAAARSTSFSMVSWPILRSACFSARSSGRRSDRWPFRPCLPAARKSSRQAASRCASTLQLPRQLLQRLTAQQPQHHLGLLPSRPARLRPIVLALLIMVVHRHEGHLHPCLSGVQPNRERWTISQLPIVFSYVGVGQGASWRMADRPAWADPYLDVLPSLVLAAPGGCQAPHLSHGRPCSQVAHRRCAHSWTS